MTFEKLDHTESFLNFFKVNFPNEQVPPCPKQPSDLNMTVRMALSSWDQGKLYQNLFSNSGAPSAPLPADTAVRLTNNALEAQDASALRNANLEHFAQQCEALGEQQRDDRFISQAEIGRREFVEAQKRVAIWNDASFGERLGMSPPSDKAVAQARQQWGISGD